MKGCGYAKAPCTYDYYSCVLKSWRFVDLVLIHVHFAQLKLNRSTSESQLTSQLLNINLANDCIGLSTYWLLTLTRIINLRVGLNYGITR